MNLTTGKWIPIVWDDGRAEKVSLLDVFQKGDTILDLAVRPHERIALMRLFICIAQASLDGPKDRADWLSCRERLPRTASDYLKKWAHAFELFGDGQRFLQMKDQQEVADEDGAGDAAKLDFGLAAGNNSTLFDNAGGSGRKFAEGDVALRLLTYQNYSPLVGRGYKGRSPCIEYNMLHSLIIGSNLLETLCLNLLTVEQVDLHIGNGAWAGRPVWEYWGSLLKRETVAEKEAKETYLGRLCPVERAIWLAENGTGMQMGNGFEYPDFRESTATIVLNKKKDDRVPLSASVNRGIWRELASITVKGQQETKPVCGPLALQNLAGDSDVVIWSGALVSDSKSKLIDTVESTYSIPTVMFNEPRRKLFQQGVDRAGEWERILGKAIATFRRALKDEIEGELWKRGVKVKHKAASHYWTSIEQQVPLLLALVKDPSPLYPDGAAKENWGGTKWGRTLARTAKEAYELACPHETARQLKAYTLGLNVLFEPAKADVEQPLDKENEE